MVGQHRGVALVGPALGVPRDQLDSILAGARVHRPREEARPLEPGACRQNEADDGAHECAKAPNARQCQSSGSAIICIKLTGPHGAGEIRRNALLLGIGLAAQGCGDRSECRARGLLCSVDA